MCAVARACKTEQTVEPPVLCVLMNTILRDGCVFLYDSLLIIVASAFRASSMVKLLDSLCSQRFTNSRTSTGNGTYEDPALDAEPLVFDTERAQLEMSGGANVNKHKAVDKATKATTTQSSRRIRNGEWPPRFRVGAAVCLGKLILAAVESPCRNLCVTITALEIRR